MKITRTAGRFAAFSAAAAVSATLSVATPAQAEIANQQFTSFADSAGETSTYHVYADNIDWTQPVGAVFYFDGDYHYTAQSAVYSPNGTKLTKMAEVANSRNMIFVPVISPDKSGTTTWYESLDTNGNWFRELATKVITEANVDPNKVWTVGYSGGAEFITFELGADSQQSWRTGGGDIIVGGGGSNGMQTQPTDEYTQIPMHWFVGTEDDYDATAPAYWSALVAAAQGRGMYLAAGFTNTEIHYVEGSDHYGYDFTEILEDTLPELTPAMNVKGAIFEHYTASGGEAVYGTPVTTEALNEDGITRVTFSSGYTLNWTEADGVWVTYEMPWAS